MKIEKIIINGCSFVHGFDFCYEKHNIPWNSSWPTAWNQMTKKQKKEFNNERLSSKLRNAFECDIVDLSISGECNDYIANKIINYINDNKSEINPETTLVIAGWSEPQRLPFYMEDLKLNVNLSLVKNYIDVILREDPTDKNNIYIAKLYEKFLPFHEMWYETETMSYTTYFRHTSLVFLLQQYLQNQGIKYCFFNSLRTWPLKPDYLSRIQTYESYDNLIDWHSWYPHRNISSYDWNWDADMDKRSTPKTLTYHPSLEAVNIFSKELSEFIKKFY